MLVVFGIVLPLIGWITTRNAIPLSISVHSSASELIVLTGYVIALSLYLIGGPQWIDQHLPSGWTDSLRIKFVITLAKKLFVFVAIPFAIFRCGFGYRIRDFGVQPLLVVVHPRCDYGRLHQIPLIGVEVGRLQSCDPAIFVGILQRECRVLHDILVDVSDNTFDWRDKVEGESVAVNRHQFLSLADPAL